MNPLLYKADPLMLLMVDLLTNPTAHSLPEIAKALFIMLAVNLVWAGWLWLGMGKIADHAPPLWLAYVLALPALWFYLPPMLNILSDVMAHEFRMGDRFILVFCVVVTTQMLGVIYALAMGKPRDGFALALQNGMAASLWMWLFSLPTGIGLLWLNTLPNW